MFDVVSRLTYCMMYVVLSFCCCVFDSGDNALTGELPTELGDLAGLKVLDVRKYYLKDLCLYVIQPMVE